MCGRYAQAKDPATLAEEFDAIDATGGAWPGPDHNVAPTTTVVGVVDRHPRDAEGTADPSRVERSLRAMRWGLVPSWAKDPSVGSRMINARAESLADKPAFRRAATSRRCLLPADGWFEWRPSEKGHSGTGKQARKTPFFMTLPSGASLALAGLWETWRAPDAEKGAAPMVSTTVVTTDAVGPLAEVHERMPLFLPAQRWAQWLDPDRAEVADLLVPPPEELLTAIEMRQVSTLVNNVRNHGPELVEEAAGDEAERSSTGGRREPEQAGLDLDVFPA